MRKYISSETIPTLNLLVLFVILLVLLHSVIKNYLEAFGLLAPYLERACFLLAQKIVYGAFARVEEKTERPALEVFEEAMNNVMPVLEVKARRIGGATYQVPIEVRPDRRQALGLRWLTTFSRNRGEKTMEERLANEIMDAANNTGASVKRKEDMRRTFL